MTTRAIVVGGGRPVDEEEQGQRTAPVGGRAVDEAAMGDLAEGVGSQRVAAGEGMDERDQNTSRKEDVVEENEEEMEKGGDFVRIEKATRTDTEGTLVARDDDDDDDDDDGGDDDDADMEDKFDLHF